MPVSRRYYQGMHDGAVQAFLIDANDAHQAAHRESDPEGARAILRLWLDHFDGHLGRMSASSLIDYIETRQAWRRYKDWTVIRNPDLPSIAYTAQIEGTDNVTLIALGICYRYPQGSELAWWSNVILPRLMRL